MYGVIHIIYIYSNVIAAQDLVTPTLAPLSRRMRSAAIPERFGLGFQRLGSDSDRTGSDSDWIDSDRTRI